MARWDVDGWRCAPGAVEGVAGWLRDGWDEVGGGEVIREKGKGSVWWAERGSGGGQWYVGGEWGLGSGEEVGAGGWR